MVVVPLLCGCLTIYMWEDHEWETRRAVEIPDSTQPDGVRFEDRYTTNLLSSTAKILATPFTLAVDITLSIFTIWLISEGEDEHHDRYEDRHSRERS